MLMFEIKYLELMLAMFSPNQIKKKKNFLPENTMLQSSAIKASSS